MTREEAIRMLIRLKDRINFEVTDSQKKMDALNMAIKALEQEPCEVSEYDKDHIWYKGHQYISLRRFAELKAEEYKLKAESYKEPCEDAISRQDAIVQISCDFPNLELPMIKKSMDKLPPVQPKAKTRTEGGA